MTKRLTLPCVSHGVAIAATLMVVSACGRSGTTTEAPRSVTVYVSTDRVFSEPVLQEYQRLGMGRRLVGHVARRFLSPGIRSM